MLGYVVKHMATKDDLGALEARLDRHIDKLDAKIDQLDTKLGKFEENEIDKRKRLEVRVGAIERPRGLDRKSPPNQCNIYCSMTADESKASRTAPVFIGGGEVADSLTGGRVTA